MDAKITEGREQLECIATDARGPLPHPIRAFQLLTSTIVSLGEKEIIARHLLQRSKVRRRDIQLCRVLFACA
jgi:hypothetical protein